MARFAGQAHGIATREELLRAGVSRDQIRRRLRKGSLIQEFRGVYRVGHRAPSRDARYMAAVKACGRAALLCGDAAAHLWGLIGDDAPLPRVIAPTKRRIEGVTTYRARTTIPATVWHGIPVTTVPRTIIDLAAILTPYELARACHEADVKYGTHPEQIEAVMRHNMNGAAKLKSVLRGDTKVTLSRLERRFLELLRQHDLPLPETNHRAGSKRVDCRWHEHRLTVELDSYTYHRSRHAWEQDRRREREAHARGDDLRRYTHGDVYDHPELVLRELATLLRS